MTVDEYLKCISERRKRALASESELRPVAPAELMVVEHELRRPFPAPYENFLTRVGAGQVSCGRWLHLDPTLPGNVLQGHEAICRALGKHRCTVSCRGNCASDLYPIFEGDDGRLYGFVAYGGKRDGGFRSTVYVLLPGETALRVAADRFSDFLGFVARREEAKVTPVQAALS